MINTQISILNEEEWAEEDVVFSKKREPKYLDFDDDPLALVCGCLRLGKDLCETFTTVEQTGNRHLRFTDSLSDQDRELSGTIRRYFKNRIMSRRLKNEFVSEWMKRTESVLETPKRLQQDYISLLVKLPDFYRENKEREAIFKKHTSMPNPVNAKTSVTELDSLVQFVGSVERNSKSQKHVTFYFSTEENYLVAANVEKSDIGYKLWDWISRNNRPFRLKNEAIAVASHPGYDFYHMKLNPNYEIENA